VAALLRLEPLPELSATAWIYALSLLLTLASTVGLFALYKMVAVVVEFAERRANFVSAVTHELKTPLTSIRMYGEMLRDGVVADDTKRQGYYATITAEAERLTRLLQNVLELGRLEKGNRVMSFSVAPVADVLDDVVAVLGPHAGKLGFELRLDVEEDLPQVRYDRDALVQVMLNLVDNALKYSKEAADKEVVLSCRRAADGGGVDLTVTDHGPGVAREYLGKIFEPFYRGEDEMTRRTKGTGIGLSLVQGLVERMNGSVTGRNLGRGGFEVRISLATS
jgi:signal transduction histidine kinase